MLPAAMFGPSIGGPMNKVLALTGIISRPMLKALGSVGVKRGCGYKSLKIATGGQDG